MLHKCLLTTRAWSPAQAQCSGH